MQLAWFDRTGKQLGTLGDKEYYFAFQFSPDGRKLATAIGDPGDIWIYDVGRGTKTRLTFAPVNEDYPIWSPDGSQIVFSSPRRRIRDLYLKSSTGNTPEELLLESAADKVPSDWSIDGRFILFVVGTPGAADIWVLPMFGDRKPFPFVETPADEYAARFSPDMRWIAYVSDGQTYVAPFSARQILGDRASATHSSPAGKWQISTTGGTYPRWSRDGKQLYYIASEGLMVTEVAAHGPNFEVLSTKRLFQPVYKPIAYAYDSPYDTAPDGRRFLFVTAPEHAPSPIALVINWTADLEKH